MITAFEIMTSGNRLKFVLVSCAVWIVLSLEGAKGTNIGGDEARFRRRRDNHESYYGQNNGDAITTCNCTSQSSGSRLTCKTPNVPEVIDTYCEPGEVHIGDSCYEFVTHGQSRDESVLDCIQHNSHLAYIETSQEQDSLKSYMPNIDYWLGLVSVDVTYIWMNGTAVAQDLFTVDEDDNGNCVSLRLDIQSVNIMTDKCSKSKRFICEKDQTSAVECDTDYEGSCYKIYREKSQRKGRDDASAECLRDWGGHLLYIETSGELEYSKMNLLNGNDHWVGLNVTRTYEWMDGTPAMVQTFEPSKGNECFRILRRNRNNWGDRECTSTNNHICERRTYESHILQPAIAGDDWCQSFIPNDLIQLSESGSLCIDLGDISSTPILRRCDAHKNVEGCSCYRDAESDELIQCGCGYCKLNFTDYDRTWPSAFSCNCSAGMADANFIIFKEPGNTAFTCSPGRPPSTTPTSTTTRLVSSSTTGEKGTAVTTSAGTETSTDRTATTAASTTLVSSSTTGEKATVAGVASNGGAVAAGVILAVVFLVGLLVVVFFVWRRKRSEKRSERSDKSPAAKNPYASGHLETVNPTYDLDELDLSKQSDLILKPVQGVGVHAVRNPTYDIGDEKETPNDYTYIKSPEDKRERNTYTDVQPIGYEAYRPNHQPDLYTALKGTNESDNPATYTPIPDTAGESYATIASSGYTAYNPTKQDEGVYTDPLSTRDTDDDDPLVYNDRGKPAKKVTNDVDNEYVGLGDVPPQRHATAAATKIPSAPGASGDSDYVDVDAKEPRVLKPTVSPRKKGGENVNLEASTGDGNYVSVDAPTSQGNQGDELSTTEDDYFKLENSHAPSDDDDEAPQEDHTYNSLGFNARKGAPGQGITDDPDNNTYNTVDRTHKRQAPKSVRQSPAQGNIYGKVNVKDDNAYDAINRTGGGVKYPAIAADDGDYSLTVPPRDDTYNSFDRSHGRNKKPKPSDQVSQNDYGSLANNDDSEYATFD